MPAPARLNILKRYVNGLRAKGIAADVPDSFETMRDAPLQWVASFYGNFWLRHHQRMQSSWQRFKEA